MLRQLERALKILLIFPKKKIITSSVVTRAFGNLVPRDVASRAAKERCDAGYGVNDTGQAVFLDFASAIVRYGKTEASIQNLNNPSQEKITELGKGSKS